MSSVELVITPEKKDLGDNFEVRRALPDRRKRMVGPFVFWDHMGPAKITPEKGMKVRAHPHIGLATITWLFSGEIMHRDSLGTKQMIQPGGVNWMTAGNGIVHSERAEPIDKSYDLEGIQLWLALPKEHEKVDASFYHCKEVDVPLIEKNGLKMRLVAGEAFNHKSPVPVYSDLFYLNVEGESESNFELNLSKNQEAAVYVINGSIDVEGSIYSKYDLIVFKQGEDINLKLSEDAHFMVFGGEVFPEKRFMWWNFVATSQELIEEAKRKWKNQEYPEVIDEDEFIPLPEN